MATSRYATMHQHVPLRIPHGWGNQEKQLIVQLEELFDDVYRRFGRLRLQDLGTPLAQTITDTSAGVDQAAKDIVTVGENTAYLERDVTDLAEALDRVEQELVYKADQTDLDDYIKITDLKDDVLELLESERIEQLAVTTLAATEIECPEGSITAKDMVMNGKPVATEDWVGEQLKDILDRLSKLEGT